MPLVLSVAATYYIVSVGRSEAVGCIRMENRRVRILSECYMRNAAILDI